jgi:hypothetical protein
MSRSNVAGALQSLKGVTVNCHNPCLFENSPTRSLLGLQAYLGYTFSVGFLNPEDGTDWSCRNVGEKLPMFAVEQRSSRVQGPLHF